MFTSGGRPATLEYANDWGITVRPTVMPATRSPSPSWPVYRGSQVRIGSLL